MAAAILGVTKATIGRWAAKGAFNRYGSSRKAVYLASELTRFMTTGIGVTGNRIFQDHNPAVNMGRGPAAQQTCPACGPGSDHGVEAHPELEEIGEPHIPFNPDAVHEGPAETCLGCRPDPDYHCGAAYCDDPACTTHGPRREDAELGYLEAPAPVAVPAPPDPDALAAEYERKYGRL